MRSILRVGLVVLFCVGAAGAAIYALLAADPRLGWGGGRKAAARRPIAPIAPIAEAPSPPAPEPRAPEAAPASPREVVLIQDALDNSGVDWAHEFTGAIHDPRSLGELRDAIAARGRLGVAVLKAELDQLRLGPSPASDRLAYAAKLGRSLGLLLMYEGRFEEASAVLRTAEERAEAPGVPADLRDEITALRAIVALRRGETDNCIACLGPSSCIFPIAAEAAHSRPAGSREAIEHLNRYLKRHPGDLRARWLLNIASMTLDEYPEKVPTEQRIPIDAFRSKIDVGHFENVAMPSGLTARTPNQAGGSAFDDFTGDGLPDIFTTSLDADLGAALFVNKGDGTFEERSDTLRDQVYALNLAKADYDNDGDLDVLLLRGAWDVPMRLSLLRNRGDGTFDDATESAGLTQLISSESACWGDYDNDGHLDLFVCGELRPFGVNEFTFKPNPTNRSRLYHNRGDGTFEDVAERAGLGDEGYAKGSAWGDYDGDGRLDLFVSNMNGPCRLYHNEGDGSFRDQARELHADVSDTFACWFWDFDNDGRLDIFVNGRGSSLADTAAFALGIKPEKPSYPHLLRNLGSEGFRDVSAEAGLQIVTTPMGCNFGDFDNDGYLDFYLGTGGMSFSHLVPNLMFKNMAGKSFEDVTMSSGTGHLQKGHGVSFADYDGDGDLDLFVEAGGAAPGDRSHNLLFRNPGHGRHSLAVRLIGTKSNRSAIGARISATVAGPDGSKREVYRTIGNNASFGGNSFTELIGLGDSTSVDELEVRWPSGGVQSFRDLKGDGSIEITEGSDSPRRIR